MVVVVGSGFLIAALSGSALVLCSMMGVDIVQRSTFMNKLSPVHPVGCHILTDINVCMTV